MVPNGDAFPRSPDPEDRHGSATSDERPVADAGPGRSRWANAVCSLKERPDAGPEMRTLRRPRSPGDLELSRGTPPRPAPSTSWSLPDVRVAGIRPGRGRAGGRRPAPDARRADARRVSDPRRSAAPGRSARSRPAAGRRRRCHSAEPAIIAPMMAPIVRPRRNLAVVRSSVTSVARSGRARRRR